MLSTAASPIEDDQPLAKADQGYVQCYEPDDAAKTCQSIASYNRTSDGHWDSTAIVLLSPKLSLTLETVTPIDVKNGAVCGYIRANDLLKGTLRVSGQPLPSEKAGTVLPMIAKGMATLFDKEICTQYREGPGGLVAKATIEGGKPEMPNQRVKWVLPTDGYTVASPPPSTAPAG
jgi:hypothetical protein